MRGRLVRVVAVVGALVAGPAAAVEPGPDFAHSYLVLNLRAAAIEPEVVPVGVMGVGYSHVNLDKNQGLTHGSCRTRGAGAYWTDEIEGPGLQSGNEEPAVGGPVNPTEARDYAPGITGQDAWKPGGGPEYTRYPQVRSVTDRRPLLSIPAHGEGVRWEAQCDTDLSGTATGANTDLAGVKSAGSTTAGRVDPATGEYVGTSRAYVARLQTPGGVLDLVSSVMAIRALPGREPVVSYRIGTTGGTLASGVDVPLGAVAAQFNRSVRQNAETVDALGPFGLTLMGPTVSTSENGNRPILNAPFLELTAGLTALKGRIGENTHTRLVNIDFEGLYGR